MRKGVGPTTPLPVPLQCLISILKVTYTVAIFPQTMSYTYMMKLDDAQAEKRIIWANKLYVATFVAITTLGIMFFSVLHLIALELDLGETVEVCGATVVYNGGLDASWRLKGRTEQGSWSTWAEAGPAGSGKMITTTTTSSNGEYTIT